MTQATEDMDTLEGMPQPVASPDDTRPRTPAEPHNPEAPYGYIKDRKTGEMRPKLTRGRQSATRSNRSKAKAAATSPPAARAATKPRTAPAPSVSQAERTAQAHGALSAVWYLAAHIPAPPAGATVLGRDLGSIHTRLQASAAVLNTHAEGVSDAIGLAAKHSGPVASVLDSLSSSSGPAWVIPVMMALVPFAGAMGAVWRSPIEDVEQMAAATRAQVAAMRKAAAPEPVAA